MLWLSFTFLIFFNYVYLNFESWVKQCLQLKHVVQENLRIVWTAQDLHTSSCLFRCMSIKTCTYTVQIVNYKDDPVHTHRFKSICFLTTHLKPPKNPGKCCCENWSVVCQSKMRSMLQYCWHRALTTENMRPNNHLFTWISQSLSSEATSVATQSTHVLNLACVLFPQIAVKEPSMHSLH